VAGAAQNDEGHEGDDGDSEVVALVDDPAPRKVQPVAEVGEDAAGAASNCMCDVARAACQGVEPNQREPDRDYCSCGDGGTGDRDAPAEAEQCERRKARRVDDQPAAIRAQAAPADDDERGESDND
jgi:hypothetical protein